MRARRALTAATARDLLLARAPVVADAVASVGVGVATPSHQPGHPGRRRRHGPAKTAPARRPVRRRTPVFGGLGHTACVAPRYRLESLARRSESAPGLQILLDCSADPRAHLVTAPRRAGAIPRRERPASAQPRATGWRQLAGRVAHASRPRRGALLITPSVTVSARNNLLGARRMQGVVQDRGKSPL